MNFEKMIKECKPAMYYFFKQYKIDGYDSDDLFQETIVWILRDWKTIISLKGCEIQTAMISRARWVCSHLSFYSPKIKQVELTEFSTDPVNGELTNFDIAHLLIRAQKKLSQKAFHVFYTKINPTDTMLKEMKKEVPTRRGVQSQLKITNRPYEKAMKEIRGFLNDEGIHSHRG